jgi:hypothetical protein
MSFDAQRLYTEIGFPADYATHRADLAMHRRNYLRLHMDRRDPGWNDLKPEKQIFFQGNEVYSKLGGTIDKRRIGTILNKNENGSLFSGEPIYTVKFKNVSDGGNERINPSCYQSDLVLKMPGEMQDEEGVAQGAAQGGGKNRKISKKHRKSKHRKTN